MGATNWQLANTALFLHAELHRNVSGARVVRVLTYVCIKCDHASAALHRLDGRPKVKRTGHALNVRMLSTRLHSTADGALLAAGRVGRRWTFLLSLLIYLSVGVGSVSCRRPLCLLLTCCWRPAGWVAAGRSCSPC